MLAAHALRKSLGGLTGGWLVGQFSAFFFANIATAKISVFAKQRFGSSLAATICGVAVEDATYYAIVLLTIWAVRASGMCGTEAKKQLSRLTWITILVGVADTVFRLGLIYACLIRCPGQGAIFAVSSAADVLYALVLLVLGLKSRPLLRARCL
jgi:hypothetical protein